MFFFLEQPNGIHPCRSDKGHSFKLDTAVKPRQQFPQLTLNHIFHLRLNIDQQQPQIFSAIRQCLLNLVILLTLPQLLILLFNRVDISIHFMINRLIVGYNGLQILSLLMFLGVLNGLDHLRAHGIVLVTRQPPVLGEL